MLLSRKLPIAAAILTMVSIAVASTASLMIGSQSLLHKEEETLQTSADSRRQQIEAYLGNIEKDLIAKSNRFDVQSAIVDFQRAWGNLESDPLMELQGRYIKDNPNPLGKKHLLDTAGKDAYDSLHQRYHPRFRAMLEAQEYYDIFLIDPSGNVIYSVFKELDYATNILTGEWKDSDLGNVFRDVMAAGNPDQTIFKDYRPYGPSYDAPASFIGKAIKVGNSIAGVLVFQMPSDAIKSIMWNHTGLGQTGETILLNNDGYLIIDSDKTEGNDSLKTKLDSPLVENARPDDILFGTLDGYRNMVSDVATVRIAFKNADWVVAALIEESEALAGVTDMRNAIIVIALALLAATLIVSTWFSRSISTPISRLATDMVKLSEGHTDIDLESKARKDEIGEMVKSVIVFRDAAIEKKAIEQKVEADRSLSDRERADREAAKAEETKQMQLAVASLAEGLARLSAGDLTVKLKEPFIESLEGLRADFNASVQKLNQTLTEIRDNTISIDGDSREIRSASDELSGRTEQQAAALQQTSAALVEITATVKETSERAAEAAKVASTAKSDTDTSGKIVADAVDAMNGIEKASGEISKIINVIDDIAFQTNLLALNAGVEAARAGDAGKGFAVVAQEVRELAQRAATAANEIKELINTSGTQVSNGVKLVQATGTALDQISENVTDINRKIGSIATAAREQLTGVEEVSSAVDQMDQVTQKNAAMVEETTAVTHRLADEVGSLTASIGNFQLSGVRAEGPRPIAKTSQEVPSPARRMVKAVASAFGGGAAAVNAATAGDDWQEF